jgi:hypothetical protein
MLRTDSCLHGGKARQEHWEGVDGHCVHNISEFLSEIQAPGGNDGAQVVFLNKSLVRFCSLVCCDLQGTAKTEALELHEIYDLSVSCIQWLNTSQSPAHFSLAV